MASLKPGVPFSTRLLVGAKPRRPNSVMGNRAFVRAWAARRATRTTLAAPRAW